MTKLLMWIKKEPLLVCFYFSRYPKPIAPKQIVLDIIYKIKRLLHIYFLIHSAYIASIFNDILQSF